VNSSALSTKKGTIKLNNARFEINSKLENKELFRFNQNTSVKFQNSIELNNCVIANAWSNGRTTKAVTCNASTLVNIIFSNCKVSGLIEIYNNDSLNATNSIQSHNTYETVVNTITEGLVNHDGAINNLTVINKLFDKGITNGSTLLDAQRGFYKNGDIMFVGDYTTDNKKVFAYVAFTKNAKGIRTADPTKTSTFKLDLTAGSSVANINDVAFNVYDNLFIPGMELIITGAGAGGADLNTVVTDTNLTVSPKTITLANSAQTSVTATSVKIPQTNLYEVPLFSHMSAPPANSDVSNQQRDIIFNTQPYEGTYLGWVYTWDDSIANYGWIPFTQVSAKKGITASRPTGVRAGYMYFDTTLATNGKPIWYNGTNWVDALGTIV
jgi:hypothetical protein